MPTELDRARQWFLSRGLPLVLAPRVRAHRIVRRTTPFLAALQVFGLVGVALLVVLDVPEAELERRLDHPGWGSLLLALLIGMFVAPVLVGWLVGKVIRGPGGAWAMWTVLLLGILVIPIGEDLLGLAAWNRQGIWSTPWYGGIALQVLTALVVVGLNYLGLGSIVLWALRFAWQQLGALGNLAGRALPLLMLTVVVFFTGELWAWAHMVDRPVVWRTVAFLAAVAVIFMITSMRDELRQLSERLATPGEIGRLLKSTPLVRLAVPDTRRSLSLREKINVIGVLLVAQLIQVVLFSVVVFGFFVGLGGLMLPDAVVESWAGGPVTPGSWFGLDLPLSNELIQMSLFVAVLSGLYFTVHSTIDPQYRLRFFDPLVEDVAESLAGREVYLEATGGER